MNKEKRLCELTPGAKIANLTKDTKKVGKFFFHGVHADDLTAEIAVFDGKFVGMIFPVAKSIEKLLDKKDAVDPTDRERIEQHIKRCIDEEYIAAFAQLIENDFEEEIIDRWRTAYGYRFIPADNRYVRLILLCPSCNEDADVLKRIANVFVEYHAKKGYDEFDAAPAYGPNAFKKRPKA